MIYFGLGNLFGLFGGLYGIVGCVYCVVGCGFGVSEGSVGLGLVY